MPTASNARPSLKKMATAWNTVQAEKADRLELSASQWGSRRSG
jgi:hypothetical protein